MVIDELIEQIIAKKNPCIVGIDPEWSKIPDCYKAKTLSAPDSILKWATDVIDVIADIVPAVKPQIAFFEVKIIRENMATHLWVPSLVPHSPKRQSNFDKS